jgi:DNA-binding GntR family transcriptional regulator
VYDTVFVALADAVETACRDLTGQQLTALRDSVAAACQLPGADQWDRKAAAHAAFFTVLAEVGGDSAAGLVLARGGELARDLLQTAGPVANGIVVNSRRRFMQSLADRDAEGAALEVEMHFRALHFMCRLQWTARLMPVDVHRTES